MKREDATREHDAPTKKHKRYIYKVVYSGCIQMSDPIKLGLFWSDPKFMKSFLVLLE
jgi:hypothetical protein